jgi:hypothetical protein
MLEFGLQFLQIQDAVHELFLRMLNPVQGFQICAVKICSVFLFTESSPRFEHIYDGEDNGIQRLVRHAYYLPGVLYLKIIHAVGCFKEILYYKKYCESIYTHSV